MPTPRLTPSRGTTALRALRAELRRPVSDRDDNHLLVCAERAGILVRCLRDGPRGHWDAVATTVVLEPTRDRDGGWAPPTPHRITQAMASDTTLRRALSRLLRTSYADIYAALVSPQRWTEPTTR